MGLVQVIIDDSTDKTITGQHTFDRNSGGILIPASGTSFPGTPVEGEWFWRTDEDKLYRYNGSGWDAVSAAVGSHGSTHENGGADEISVAGLSGVLTDDQPAQAHAIDGAKHTGSLAHSSLSGIAAGDHHDHPAISAYDSLGNQTFTGLVTLNLDSTNHIDGSYFTLASDEITVTEAGVYAILGHVTLDVSSGTVRSIGGARLQLDSGSGYSVVPGTNVFLYNRNAGAGENTGAFEVVTSLSAGDKLRIQLTRVAGSNTLATKADASGMVVWRIQ